jgi:nifR3 family TIM-barrel protein
LTPDTFFRVRDVEIQGDLILAPMDGYSDQPFRSICRELGSAMSYTEFINAIDVLYGHPRLEEKLAFLPAERPVVYQLFDNDLNRLLEAALRLQERGPDLIDINLGCSARCVSGRGAGAGLLRQPESIAQIFASLSRALRLPLSAKMRLGWDDGSRNYRLVARIIEENGGALIAVHGRTRAQRYAGQADWDAIAEIKQAVSIPVIANGDVRCVADIERIQSHTACDGVMIGRAARGNPWIFARLDRQDVPRQQICQTMLRHLERMLAFYGPEHGLLRFRKHADRYLSHLDLPPGLRQRLLTAQDAVEFSEALQTLNA